MAGRSARIQRIPQLLDRTEMERGEETREEKGNGIGGGGERQARETCDYQSETKEANQPPK